MLVSGMGGHFWDDKVLKSENYSGYSTVMLKRRDWEQTDICRPLFVVKKSINPSLMWNLMHVSKRVHHSMAWLIPFETVPFFFRNRGIESPNIFWRNTSGMGMLGNRLLINCMSNKQLGNLVYTGLSYPVTLGVYQVRFKNSKNYKDPVFNHQVERDGIDLDD